MEKIYSIVLYISTTSLGNVMFDAAQGDTGRKIRATILNDDGTAFSPGSGTTAEYWSLKADKNGTQHPASISGNVVTVQLTDQDLAVPGRTYAAVVLKQGSTILAAMPFWFMVVPVPIGPDIESTSEYQIMVDATEAAEEAAENANNAAEHGPYIRNTDLHWMIWDNDLQQYVDTGVPASGAEGVVLYSSPQTLTDAQKDQARTNIGAEPAAEVGSLAGLSTTDKTSIVNAINEVDGHADDNAASIGNLTNLSTTAKNNLVSAINEVDADCEAVGISNVIEVTTPSFNSLPRTFNAAGITAAHELIQEGYAYVSVPSAMGADWELDTGAGTVTIKGTFSGSTPTSVKATFGIKNKVTATS